MTQPWALAPGLGLFWCLSSVQILLGAVPVLSATICSRIICSLLVFPLLMLLVCSAVISTPWGLLLLLPPSFTFFSPNISILAAKNR